MTSRNTFVSIVLCTIFLSAVTFSQTINDPSLIREDDPDYQRQRREWMEQMHRTEPGVNYRILDFETRTARRRLRQSQLLSEPSSGLVTLGNTSGRWIERGSVNLSGRIHLAEMDFAHDLVYAASAGGNVWRGTLEGKNWQSLNDTWKFGSIQMLKVVESGSTHRIIVAASGPSRVYYSDDDGKTWQTATGLENAARWGYVRRAVMTEDGQHHVYILVQEWNYKDWGAVAAVYRSADLGTSFELVERYRLSGLSVKHLDLWAPTGGKPGVYFIRRDTLSLIKADGKVAFLTLVNTAPPVKDSRSIHLKGYSDSVADRLYLQYSGSGGTSLFFFSADTGKTWLYRGDAPTGMFSTNSFCVSRSTPAVLFIGGVEQFTSTDSGATWIKTNKWGHYYGNPKHKLHADIPGITTFITPNSEELIFIATDGGLYISTDTTRTVTNISMNGLNVSQYYGTYTNRNNLSILYAGSQDQGFQRSTVDGEGPRVFRQLISGDYGHLTSSNGGDALWCDYPGFVMLYPSSTDPSPRNKTWSFKDRSRLWLPPVTADPADPYSAFVAVGGTTGESKITYLTFSKEQNKIIASELPFDFSLGNSKVKVSAIAVSPFDFDELYVLTSAGNFFRSTDGGNTWTRTPDFKAPGNHYFYGTAITPSQKTPGTIFIGGSGYSNPGVFVSTDHGNTFKPITRGLPKTLVYELAVTPDEKLLFAATAVGPYAFNFADSTWYDIAGATTPDQTYWTVDYIPALKTARFGTYGRGIWDFKLESILAVQPRSSKPADFAISAFPSPARGVVTFSIMTSKAAEGSLRIYDSGGRVVAEFKNRNFHRGANLLRWQGATDEGFPLPSGAYLAVLSLNGRAVYTKVLLLR